MVKPSDAKQKAAEIVVGERFVGIDGKRTPEKDFGFFYSALLHAKKPQEPQGLRLLRANSENFLQHRLCLLRLVPIQEAGRVGEGRFVVNRRLSSCHGCSLVTYAQRA
jgi:hypothetical protein